MAEVATAAQVAVDAPQAAAPDQGFWGIAKGLIVRGLMIYFITSMFSKRGGSPPPTDPAGKAVANIAASNAYPDASQMDLYAYISGLENIESRFPKHLVWKQSSLVYGDWLSGVDGDGCYSHNTTIATTESLRNNGSLWLHAFLTKAGASPDPSQSSHHAPTTVHSVHRLNKFMKLKYKKTANLITGKTEKSEEEIKKAETIAYEVVSHWHPNITINLVHDFTAWVPGAVPEPLAGYMRFSANQYQPVMFMNNYWSLIKDYQPINETVANLNLTITFQPLSMFKWQMYATQLSKNKWGGALMEGLQGQEDEGESDAMKEALLETSPAFLIFTAIASLLHTIFEMLAFKNDIQFWNNRQSLEGLSIRSVFFNVFQALIVLLYVCDNDTNFVIKMSCAVELCIQLWKISKIKNVTLDWSVKHYGVFPGVKVADVESYTRSQTDKFDKMAFRYVGMALFPLLGAYAVYSLVYLEHTGWYSFVLSFLYGFLLTFGFINMTPQLFINYKMKSVAHLPWRMMTYKAINTFIDDIFAFVIKMPTMYRIGCLRDDVIFIIFLYQRYIYRIDPSRVNEFGFSQDMERDALNKTDAAPGGAIEASPVGAITQGDAEEDKSPQEKKED